MTMRLTIAVFLAAQFVAIDFASAIVRPGTEVAENLNDGGQDRTSGSQEYIANRFTLVKAIKVEDETRKNLEGQTIEILKGDIVTILQQDGNLVRIGLESDEDPMTPSDFWVSADELDLAGLASYDLSQMKAEDVEAFEAQNSLVETQVARRGGGRSARGRRGGTYCYRHVKTYLLGQKEISFRPGGGRAHMAASELGAAGMKAGGCSPSNPTANCTCVYRGGASGHIEVYRGNGCWWYGYGCKPAMTELRMGQTGKRRLITCFN